MSAATAADANTVWVATDRGVFKSDDGGATFEFVNVVVDDDLLSSAEAVAVDPSDANKVYVIGAYIGGQNQFMTGFLYRSSDGGKSWSISSLRQGYAPALDGTDPDTPHSTSHAWFPKQCKLCIDVAAPNHWYLGYWSSADAGATWSRTLRPAIGQDFRSLAIDPGASGIVYAGFAGGMMISHDYGQTWAVHPRGPSAVFVQPLTGDLYVGGWRSRDYGETWTVTSFKGAAASIAIDWTTGDLMSGQYRSTDGGDTWRLVDGMSFPSGFRNDTIYVLADPNASGHLFSFNGQGSSLSRSTDAGLHWAQISMQRKCLPGEFQCTFQLAPAKIADIAFHTPPVPQRVPPLASDTAAPPQPAAAAPVPIPGTQPAESQGLHFVTTSDGQFYFVLSTFGWLVVPDVISDADLGTIQIGPTWNYVAASQILPADARIVRGGPANALYLVQGAQGWLLLPDMIAAQDLAALSIRGQIYGGVPAGWFASPTTVSLAPPAEPVVDAVQPAANDVPAELTDDVQQALAEAIHRANAAWAQAKASNSSAPLIGNVAGQELANDQQEIANNISLGRIETPTQMQFSVSDMSMDAPGHVTAHTVETWSDRIMTTAGRTIAANAVARYNETYTVEFQNGQWIVTLDQIDS